MGEFNLERVFFLVGGGGLGGKSRDAKGFLTFEQCIDACHFVR